MLERLRSRLDSAEFRGGAARLVGDPFFVAYFLVSVSQGEGLGEAAVGMIGQEELARRIRDLRAIEAEERGHKQVTLEAAAELFPEFFDAGVYRYDSALDGRSYYLSVLEANRERLKRLGRHSRLNLYLTTTFGYEVMVLLLYPAIADAVAGSELPERVRNRVVKLLESIVHEEAGHLGVVDQHNSLLAEGREGLAPAAREMLDALERLDASDYLFCAELAVERLAEMMRRYTTSERRAEIEAAADGY